MGIGLVNLKNRACLVKKCSIAIKEIRSRVRPCFQSSFIKHDEKLLILLQSLSNWMFVEGVRLTSATRAVMRIIFHNGGRIIQGIQYSGYGK